MMYGELAKQNASYQTGHNTGCRSSAGVVNVVHSGLNTRADTLGNMLKLNRGLNGFNSKRGFILSFFCSEKVYIYTCRFTPDFFAGVKGQFDFYTG